MFVNVTTLKEGGPGAFILATTSCTVLLNLFGFAAGQLAVFQGASEAPISESILAERNTEKQQTARGPEGCVENGPAAVLLVGYVSI